MVRQYSLDMIEKCNIGSIPIPNEPKFQSLISFIAILNSRRPERQERRCNDTRGKPRASIPDRDSFGNKKTPCLFNKPETLDDKIKCKINELNLKITEHNVEEILVQFKLIEFGEVEDLQAVASNLHSSVLACSKYGDQILELFVYLVKEHPRYTIPLRERFLNLAINKFESLGSVDEKDLESKYTIKRIISSNYELMVKCLQLGILFDEAIISETTKFLESVDNVDATEVLIRFYTNLKRNGVKYSLDLNGLEKTIKDKKYPKMLEFLLMDLEE